MSYNKISNRIATDVSAKTRLSSEGSLYITGTFETGGLSETVNDIYKLQESLDRISNGGGGVVYLSPGIYVLYADILIPNNVELRGSARDSVILECGDFSVRMEGKSVYNTGTVTINLGDTTLVGSGTTWTEDMVGKSVWLNGYFYTITEFTDTTHLEITVYDNTNLSGADYAIVDTNNNSKITTLIIQNATNAGVVMKYVNNPVINDITVWYCGTGFDMDYVLYPTILSYTVYNGENGNLNWVEAPYIYYSDFSSSTSGCGLSLTNTNNGVFFNCDYSDNTSYNLYLIDSSYNIITATGLEFGATDSVYIDSGCIGTKLNNIACNNNTGYGLVVNSATNENTIITASDFSDNTGGAVSDGGTGTLIRSNIGVADN
jgi:hypothetical protein